SMNTLPRVKRNGEPLLLIEEPLCSLVNPLLTPDAERKVERVILEYSNRQKLADHGYKPKTKLLNYFNLLVGRQKISLIWATSPQPEEQKCSCLFGCVCMANYKRQCLTFTLIKQPQFKPLKL
ncbi:MAG: hypothetical protein ACK40K_09165, partial [Raineya sp.]